MALFLRLLRKHVGEAAITVFISVLAVAASLWWNWAISSIIDTVNSGAPAPAKATFYAALAVIISSMLCYAEEMLSGWTCETITHDLRMEYTGRFSALSLIEIENLSSGEDISKLQNEISDVSGYINGNLFPTVYDCVRFAATLPWLIHLDPWLAAAAYIPSAFIMVYIIFSGRIIGALARQSQQANGVMCGYTQTLAALFPVIKLYDASKLLCSGYEQTLKQWEKSCVREEKTKAKLMSLSAVFSCLPLLLLFLVGGQKVINGSMTVGTLYMFINLSGNVTGVLMNMPARIAGFWRFAANMGRLDASVPKAA